MQLFAQNGGHGIFASGLARAEAGGEDPFVDSRRIACKKCGDFHVWLHTKKSKSRARWCQVVPFPLSLCMLFNYHAFVKVGTKRTTTSHDMVQLLTKWFFFSL